MLSRGIDRRTLPHELESKAASLGTSAKVGRKCISEPIMHNPALREPSNPSERLGQNLA
jgi:hypothetical protein